MHADDDAAAAAAQATGPAASLLSLGAPARLLCSCQISIKPKILTRLSQGHAWIFLGLLMELRTEITLIVLAFLVQHVWVGFYARHVRRAAAHVGQ